MTPPAADRDRPTDGAEARNGYARPDGVTLLDKVQFFAWADEQHQLEACEMRVLRVIVFDVLGLEGGRPFNGWSTASKLAWMCGIDERTVRRALGRLKKLGLITTTGTRGQGGRTVFYVPGVVGAAQKLPRRKLTDKLPAESDETPAQIGHGRPINAGGNRAQRSVQIGPGRPMNPSKNPPKGSEPSQWAPGDAASRPGEPPAFDLEEKDEGAFGQDQPSTLTRARHRLRQRLAGIAEKVGVQDGGEGLLLGCDEDTVRRWLKWQREKRETPLTQALLQVLIDHYGLNPAEAGRKLAEKPEPAPQPEPEPRRQEPPPPPARPPSPSPLPPAVNGAGVRTGLRPMAAAIHELLLPSEAPPRKPYVCSRAEANASGKRLGIPLRGSPA
jgi:hypothetical protein